MHSHLITMIPGIWQRRPKWFADSELPKWQHYLDPLSLDIPMTTYLLCYYWLNDKAWTWQLIEVRLSLYIAGLSAWPIFYVKLPLKHPEGPSSSQKFISSFDTIVCESSTISLCKKTKKRYIILTWVMHLLWLGTWNINSTRWICNWTLFESMVCPA